jgi:glycogen debranching enzyme
VLAPQGWAYASSPPADQDDPGRFNALFGRDSLITALQLLPVRPDVARATLRELAARQGQADDAERDEEPGKVLHEWWPQAPARLAEAGWPVHDGELTYYGSADSTSWFLVVLASLDDPALAAELEPAWRAAGEWLERALRRGNGLVRHGPRMAAGGLVQQGWRDASRAGVGTGHGIVHGSGHVPIPPLADADCQAVAIAGMRALATLSGEERHRLLAAELAERVEAAFGGAETIALERGGAPVFGSGSHLGWLLWAGGLGQDAGAAVAQRLCEPDVLTPFGLRTLSEHHPAFAGDAYHRGAVWPFDSWLGWGGLRAAGRHEEAERVRTGVLAALDRLGHAPELYAVDESGPRRLPQANLVQAWTVGARWALTNDWDGRVPALFGAA